jgi:general secretion pathway protein M
MSEAAGVQAGGPSSGASRRAGLQALATWQARWKQLGTRERVLVAVAATVLALAMLWSVGVQPAWQTLRSAPARLDALDAQTLAMRRLADQSRELRQSPLPPTHQAAQALQAASERLGSAARLSVQGDRAVLTLEGLDPQALRSWLAEVRSGARARTVEAQLVRSGPGFSGTVTVVIPASP